MGSVPQSHSSTAWLGVHCFYCFCQSSFLLVLEMSVTSLRSFTFFNTPVVSQNPFLLLRVKAGAPVMFRFRAAKSGKQSGVVCAVRKVEKRKQTLLYSVPTLRMTSQKLGSW